MKDYSFLYEKLDKNKAKLLKVKNELLNTISEDDNILKDEILKYKQNKIIKIIRLINNKFKEYKQIIKSYEDLNIQIWELRKEIFEKDVIIKVLTQEEKPKNEEPIIENKNNEEERKSDEEIPNIQNQQNKEADNPGDDPNNDPNNSIIIDENIQESNIYPSDKYNDSKSSLKEIAKSLWEKYKELKINKLRLDKNNIHARSLLSHLLNNDYRKNVHLQENLILSNYKLNPVVLGLILYDFHLYNPNNQFKTGEKWLFYFLWWNNLFKQRKNNEEFIQSKEKIKQ